MDLFERVFHISPDGGSGALEALYVVAAVAVLAALAMAARRIAARRER